MKHLIGYSLVIVVALTACNAGSGRRADVQAAPYSMAPLAPPSTNTSSGQMPASKPSWLPSQTVSLPADPAAAGRKNPPHGQPGHQCGLPVGAPLGGTTAAAPAILPVSNPQVAPAGSTPAQVQGTAAAASGMNPAHGQPGHRCDLAVGAPLAGAPAAKPATPQSSTSPAAAKPAPATAPGMNPPHGQPGHRCDIAVGAPLNSPAATKPAAPSGTENATSAAAAESQTVSPLLPANTAATPALPAAGVPKLNPPHGQPGHDCSVKVGEPLKQ